MEYAAIVLSVLIPLFVFMIALRPFIKDTIKAELVGIHTKVEGIEKGIEGFKEGQKQFIDVYQKLGKPNNPHPDKGILLEKLRNETITENEAIWLRGILTEEREQAERENNVLKVLAIIGILVLIGVIIYQVRR